MDELQEQLRIREMEWKLKKERIQKEKEMQNREREKVKEEHVQKVKQNQTDLIEKKRKDIINKQIHHEEIINKQLEENKDKIEKFKMTQQNKVKTYHEARLAIERKITEKNQQLTEKLRLSDEQINKNQAESDIKRRKEAVIRQIMLEEKKQIAMRLAKQKEAIAMETTILYEERIKKIDQKEQLKRKNLEEAERIRIALDKEKTRVMNSASSAKDIIKNNPQQLQKLADKLGINLNELQEKAKQISRGVRRPVAITNRTNGSNSSANKKPPANSSRLTVGGTPRRPTSENTINNKTKQPLTAKPTVAASPLSSKRKTDNVVVKKTQPIHGMHPKPLPSSPSSLNSNTTNNKTVKNNSNINNNNQNDKNKPMPKLKIPNH